MRLCTMKALPTDDQIDEAGAEDAGEFILELQKDPKAWDHFLSENEQTWDVEPPQPIARCVDLTLLVRVVELNTAGAHVDGSDRPLRGSRSSTARLCTHAKIREAQGLEVTHIDHDAVHHPGHITHHHEHHDHDDPHHGLGARRATHHHAHKEPSAAEPSAQMTRRHTMGLLREGTMKQQLPSSKEGATANQNYSRVLTYFDARELRDEAERRAARREAQQKDREPEPQPLEARRGVVVERLQTEAERDQERVDRRAEARRSAWRRQSFVFSKSSISRGSRPSTMAICRM